MSNPFEEMKLILNTDLNKINGIKNLFIINRFLSMELTNVKYCEKVDKWMLSCNNDILSYYLFLTCNKDKKFIKNLKKKEKKEDSLLKPYIKKYYGWGNTEYYLQEHLINFDEIKYDLNKKFGFDKTLCRKLKIKFNQPKKRTIEKKKKGVFDY